MARKKKIKIPKIAAVDLFCGAGGLTHGLLDESIVVKAGFDVDPVCEYAYEYNNDVPYIIKDVSKLTGKEIKDYFDDSEITVIAGCAPCQPFSKYTQGKDNTEDSKWGMLYEFARLVKQVKPDIVTMENVPQLKRHEVYTDFEKALKKLGYNINSTIAYCPDYGIPQTRHRLVLLASRHGEIKLLDPIITDPKKYKTVKETIEHLPTIRHGRKSEDDPLHMASSLSELNMKRMKASRPNGSWLDWDKKLVTPCHRKPERKTYRSVYGRMSWEEPSPTITTQFTGFGNGRFGHPEQHRALSLREGALLQTFPADYQFVAPDQPIYTKHVAKMIGNAVPVKLGQIIGASIRKHIEYLYSQAASA